jgi:dTDP-4-amino-4,6-dideoxygalactose transaminase
MDKFKKANIDCVVHYPRLINDEAIYHQHSALLNSDRLKSITFTVPNQHTLTDEEVERIAEVLR